MITAEEYRQKALEADLRALRVSDPGARLAYQKEREEASARNRPFCAVHHRTQEKAPIGFWASKSDWALRDHVVGVGDGVVVAVGAAWTKASRFAFMVAGTRQIFVCYGGAAVNVIRRVARIEDVWCDVGLAHGVSGQVIEKMAAAARALGWPEAKLDVLALPNFVPLDDVFGLDFIATLGIDLAVLDAVAGVLVDLMEADLLALWRGSSKHGAPWPTR
jgi:hypothetical protein